MYKLSEIPQTELKHKKHKKSYNKKLNRETMSGARKGLKKHYMLNMHKKVKEIMIEELI